MTGLSRVASITRWLATLLGAPAPRFVPPEAGSPEEGRDATSKRVANHRMKAGLGSS